MLMDGSEVSIGDAVYDVANGPGTVVMVADQPVGRHIRVRFGKREVRYSDDFASRADGPRTLFWHDPVIAAPPRDMGRMWRLVRRFVEVSVAEFREHGEA